MMNVVFRVVIFLIINDTLGQAHDEVDDVLLFTLGGRGTHSLILPLFLVIICSRAATVWHQR